MLVIRDAQINALNEVCVKEFRGGVVQYLESDFPEQSKALGPDGVNRLIDLGIKKAGGYGIEFEAEICDFVGVMAEFGEDFDQQPWAAEILQAPESSEGQRMRRLIGLVEACRRTGWKRK